MQLGFYFDQVRCTGCYACVVACKDWHDTPAGPAKWIRLQYFEDGAFPNPRVSFLAAPCYHCEEPVCSYICPNEAITKREEDGIVVIDPEKCRGEKSCGIINEKDMGPDFNYGESMAPCQTTCPAHVYIPGYVALIAKGRYQEAYNLIRRNMPLPSVCGRVCLHPCESACSRQKVDEPIAIMALKRFADDQATHELPERLPQKWDDHVAIVGSGPAGLAAAYDLIRMGYGVTIYESLPVAGGMLAVGVPDYRLPPEALQRDIDHIRALGVEIQTDHPVPLDHLDDLFGQGFSAVLLALGAHEGTTLNVPGVEDSDGVLTGTSFMKDVNLNQPPKIGKNVAVIGGGNVALDCARAAVRLGAAQVSVACLECREDMPADQDEIQQAEEEGIAIYPSFTLSQVLRDSGKITGVTGLDITGCYFDELGRPHFEIIKGSEKTLDADTIIFAVGQKPELAGIDQNDGLDLSPRGTLAVDFETLMTHHRGIFGAGDCANGPTSIIEAIASGQKAAFYINRFLQGDILRIKRKPTIAAEDIQVDIPKDTEIRKRQDMPRLPVMERISNFSEVTPGFNEAAAQAEAARCLNCAGHLCKDACPYSAPQFAFEEQAKMQKCDLCVDRWADHKLPVCVEACPVRALDAGDITELKAKYGDIREARGFVYSKQTKPSGLFRPKPGINLWIAG